MRFDDVLMKYSKSHWNWKNLIVFKQMRFLSHHRERLGWSLFSCVSIYDLAKGLTVLHLFLSFSNKTTRCVKRIIDNWRQPRPIRLWMYLLFAYCHQSIKNSGGKDQATAKYGGCRYTAYYGKQWDSEIDMEYD